MFLFKKRLKNQNKILLHALLTNQSTACKHFMTVGPIKVIQNNFQNYITKDQKMYIYIFFFSIPEKFTFSSTFGDLLL